MVPVLSETEIKQLLSKFSIEVEHTIHNICPDTTLNQRLKRVFESYNNKEIENYIRTNVLHSFKLLKTKHSQFVLHVLYSVCKSKYDINLAIKSINDLAIVYHNLLLNKYIKFCNDLLLQRALEEVKSSNVYKRYGIQKALRLLSENIVKKYFSKNPTCDLKIFVKMIYELRHRIAQTLKSVVAKYYLLHQTSKDATSKTIDYESIVNELTNTIMFYGIVNVPDGCPHKDIIRSDLVNVDENIFRNAVEEILRVIGIKATKQKIIGNINKLKYIKYLLNDLGLDDTPKNRYCLVATIYKTYYKH